MRNEYDLILAKMTNSEDVMKDLIKSKDEIVRKELAKNEDLAGKYTDILAEDESWRVRVCTAMRSDLELKTLIRLCNDKDEKVASFAVSNIILPVAELVKKYYTGTGMVKAAAENSLRLYYEQLEYSDLREDLKAKLEQYFILIPRCVAIELWLSDYHRFSIINPDDGTDRYADNFNSLEEMVSAYPMAIFGLEINNKEGVDHYDKAV